MNIRPAAPSDSPALAHIQVDSYRTAYAPLLPAGYLAQFSYEEQEQDWRDLLAASRAGELLLVAETDSGEIQGYALARQVDASQTGFDCELVAMHVRPGSYRQGTGRALMAEAARRMYAPGTPAPRALAAGMPARSCRSLGLWVLDGNPARYFYERLGGVQRGEQFFEVEEGVLRREIGFVWDDITRLFA